MMKNDKVKKLHKLYKNSGISLMVLVMTITVSLILISVVIFSTQSSIDNTNLSVFAMDLREIESSTETYYLTNNVMPTIDGTTLMDKDEILAIAKYPTELTADLTENGDLGADFYTIDLSKINVSKAIYGSKKAGDSDIFVVSIPSMNAYYLQGYKIKGVVYSSLTYNLTGMTKIQQKQVDNSTVDVTSSGGITVSKTDGWANKMGVKIETEITADESLYMSVSGASNRLITTTVGKNSFGFDLLSSIVAGTETIKVPTLTMEEANYIETPTKPYADRYIDILKYKGTDLIGKVRINLSNFSSLLPTITQATRSSYSNINTVKLLLSNSESGIKEVRYEYLKKYTENATIENYYEGISDLDITYMKSKGKKANLADDLTTIINAPKNIQSIKIALIDNAGNVNLYNQIIAPDLYVGYRLDSKTIDLLQITVNMFSINGIKTISFAISTDGINYTNEQVHTLNISTNGITAKQSDPFTGLTTSSVYVKMTAVNYDNTKTETRIVKIDLD